MPVYSIGSGHQPLLPLEWEVGVERKVQVVVVAPGSTGVVSRTVSVKVVEMIHQLF